MSGRWLRLRYPARCKVCERTLPTGSAAYWDRVTRSATCDAMTCATLDGLTRQEWKGSPVSGRWVPVLADRRIARAEDRADVMVRDPGEDAADRWAESHDC